MGRSYKSIAPMGRSYKSIAPMGRSYKSIAPMGRSYEGLDTHLHAHPCGTVTVPATYAL